MHVSLPLELAIGGANCFPGESLLTRGECCSVGNLGSGSSKCWRTEDFHDQYHRCCKIRVQRNSKTWSAQHSSPSWGKLVPTRHASLALWLRLSFWALIHSTCTESCEAQLSTALMNFFAASRTREAASKRRELGSVPNMTIEKQDITAAENAYALETVLAVLCWEALQLRKVVLNVVGTSWEVTKAVQLAFQRVWEPLQLMPWMTILTLRWPVFSLLASLHDMWHLRPDAKRIADAHLAHASPQGASLKFSGRLGEESGDGYGAEVLLFRAAMKLYQMWATRDDADGSLLPGHHREYSLLLRDVQSMLLRHASEMAGEIFHPLTFDVQFHPVGIDPISLSRRAIRGYRDTGWPSLRLLHGIHWQFVCDDADFLAEALSRARRSFPGRSSHSFPIILDAGAHVGSDSLIFSKRWPSGYIHAMEPNSAVFQTLRSNVENVSNIQIHHAALAGETNKRMHLYTQRVNPQSSLETSATATLFRPNQAHQRIMPMHESPTEVVGAFSLVAFAKSLALPHFDFLHLDLQGAEFAVLSADLSKEILSQVLLVQVEVMDAKSGHWDGVPDGSELLALLHERGFVPIARTPQLKDEAYCDVIFMNQAVAPSSLLQ